MRYTHDLLLRVLPVAIFKYQSKSRLANHKYTSYSRCIILCIILVDKMCHDTPSFEDEVLISSQEITQFSAHL